ncbi:unnamed protein product [Urochloa humidicola]
MDPLAQFHIFGAEADEPVFPKNHEAEQVPPGNGPAAARLIWNPLMSERVLHKFSLLVSEGIRTDKGFKDCHLNSVAKDLAAFINQPVTGNQLYNHLRKWRTRWVRVCKLKDLSGALWDEDLCMITLDPEHYNGHVKDHPKDKEFLNTPIVNYNFMQIVFGAGTATGRYAMGSGEPLGQAPDNVINLDNDAPPPTPRGREDGPSAKDEKINDVKLKGKKINDYVVKDLMDEKKPKKAKAMTEEDRAVLTEMTQAMKGVGTAISEGNNAEGAPGIYQAVMGCPGFARSDLMPCLNYMTKHKAAALVFVEMTDEDKKLWIETHLTKARLQMAFQ